MLRAMDSAVAGLRAHQSKLDVIGHNIANVNTFGYKSQNYAFKEAMYQTASASTAGTTEAAGTNAAQYGYGTMTGSISVSMGASTPTYVGGFNASISGNGFFIVKASNTDVPLGADNMDAVKSTECEYTRVGQFMVDSNGYITDYNSNFVMGFEYTPGGADADGTYTTTTLSALRIPDAANAQVDAADKPPVATSITINNYGIVTAQVENDAGEMVTVTVGKVAVANFQNQEGLTKGGGYNYVTDPNDNAGSLFVGEPGSGSTPSLMSGYVEASNVDMAKEFSDLITTQRGFQANSKIITVSDEILNELVNMKR